jgi:hypothetical protein
MSTNRRDFLKKASLGAGILTAGISGMSMTTMASKKKKRGVQTFNMSGFAAPKLPVVRIGFIGVGDRGSSAIERMAYIDGIEIKAICDIRQSAVETSQMMLVKYGFPQPDGYYGKPDAWKQLCERNDIDLIYICTPWDQHTPQSVYAMENNKHVAVEVPAATTVEECWQLVETSERTRKHCMMLENCCYDFFELLTLNMARQGLFGELLHAEGAYIHDLLKMNFAKPDDNKQSDGAYYDMWRLKENFKNGNLYPTHGLGPVCQAMNINRGDQMDYLVSLSTNDFQMGAMANELAASDSFYQPYANKKFRGNMNTTVIRTIKGRSIMLQHDVTSPRPYSRIHLLSGTKGIASKWPSPERIAFGHSWIKPDELKALYAIYTPEIVVKIGDMAKRVGGHGGMDFMMDWRLIDCLRNGLPLDQDVYDAASWSAIAPLSSWSVANRSNSVDVPDFTRNAWKTNTPVDLTLNGGGTTNVRILEEVRTGKQLNVN